MLRLQRTLSAASRRASFLRHASEHHLRRPVIGASHPRHVRGVGYSMRASSSVPSGCGVSVRRLLSLPTRWRVVAWRCRGFRSPLVHVWQGRPSAWSAALVSGCWR